MRHDVAVCLDELDACYERLRIKKPLSKDGLRRLNSWVNTQKRKLKELAYKGKVPRRPRNTKKFVESKVDLPPEEPEVDENQGRMCIFGELPEFG
jgi:hypothetical protein